MNKYKINEPLKYTDVKVYIALNKQSEIHCQRCDLNNTPFR